MNSTIALTLMLLSLMVGAGVVSAAWGYALGREALKGITQPDVRPTAKGGEAELGGNHQVGVQLLKEEDIINDVKTRISGTAANEQSSATPGSDVRATPVALSTTTFISTSSQPGFPISSQDQDVILEVRSVNQRQGSLVLEVSLKNNGTRPVQFLYSFMNVIDDRGRAFSANTEGLPGELPANRQSFTGQISIPLALLEGSKELSVILTDYPDQQLELEMTGIPVAR